MLTVLHERSYSVELANVRIARQALGASMTQYGLADATAQAFQLALSEILVNLTRHARPMPERMSVLFGRDHDNWVLDVLDDGGAFKDAERQLELGGEALTVADGGMGTGIVARLFPDHSYTPSHAWRDIRNRFRLRRPMEARDARPRVLVIDDDPVIRRMFAAVLKREVTILTAETAEQAKAVLLSDMVDMVICDIRMPGVSGVELRKALVESHRFADLPFVFVTGDTDGDLAREAETMPIDDLLAKPVRPERLRQVVRRTLIRSYFLRKRERNRLAERMTDMQHPGPTKDCVGFRTEVRWRVAEAGGGDLVAWIQHQEGMILVLADLMGHGVSAKLEARALVAFLEGAFAADRGLGPADAMRKLSDGILGTGAMGEMIVTLQIALLCRDGEVVVAGAGHPPPLSATGRGVTELPVAGALPGLTPGALYQDFRYRPEPGERVLFFTDGLYERVELDLPSVMARAYGETDPADAADCLIAAFDAAAPQPLRDDVTLVVVAPG